MPCPLTDEFCQEHGITVAFINKWCKDGCCPECEKMILEELAKRRKRKSVQKQKPESTLREMNITLECRSCGAVETVNMKAPEAKEKYNAFFEKHPAFCAGSEGKEGNTHGSQSAENGSNQQVPVL